MRRTSSAVFAMARRAAALSSKTRSFGVCAFVSREKHGRDRADPQLIEELVQVVLIGLLQCLVERLQDLREDLGFAKAIPNAEELLLLFGGDPRRALGRLRGFAKQKGGGLEFTQ